MIRVEYRYWKAIVRYGHVGRKNEISVARYIAAEMNLGITDVMNLIGEMPGVKFKGVGSIQEICLEEYVDGKLGEEDNLFLRVLKTFKPRVRTSVA